MAGGLDCGACRETFEEEGEEPPCHECGRPRYDHPANSLAWKVWRICSSYERPAAMGGVAPIRATSVVSLIKDFGGGERDLDKVLKIEHEMLPVIRENAKASQPKKES